jgi:hypothetical protein
MRFERLNLVRVVWRIAFLAVPASAYGADKPYDFKGIQLGKSQADFRKTSSPNPDPRQHGRVLCTGDDKDQIALWTTADENLSGITKCIFFGSFDLSTGLTLHGEQLALDMGGSKYASYRYSFFFVPDPKDHVPKLYRIMLPTNLGAMEDVIEALTDKFGPATNSSTGVVRNKLGAKFTQKTYTWTNSTSQILVQGPWSEIDDMVVVYRLLSLDEFVNNQAQAQRRAQKNRM